MIKPDLAHGHDSLVLKQGAHGGQFGTPVPMIDCHGGSVLLDQAFRVDADCRVDVGRGMRQLQHAGRIAGVGGTFQHPHHAARGQGLQQRGAVSVKLTRGIVRMGIKNMVHACFSCGARLTR